MDKLTLMVMDKEREKALEHLRELGVVHLERKQVQSEVLSRLLEKKAKLESALGVLRPYDIELKKKSKKYGHVAFKTCETDPVSEVLALVEEKKKLQEQLLFLGRERNRVEKWGDFDPSGFAALNEAGVVLIPYELSVKNYNALDKEIPLIPLGRDKSSVRFLAVGCEIAGETPFALPERSLAAMDAYRGELADKLAGLEEAFIALVPLKNAIEAEEKVLLESIEFESARAGMDVLEAEEYEKALFADRTVSWLSGYVPKDKLGVIKRGASEYGWALIADEPGLDDPVPTLLKNNRLVSLLNPLTDFLETVPGYREVDISGWFLLFFCIFFGMIFGDAGYGSLLFLIALIGMIKTFRKGIPGFLKLLLLLSIANIGWGVATCSWFGIDPARLPGVLKNIAVPYISGAAPPEQKGWVDQNLQLVCFTLALLQLGIAHIKGIFKCIKAASLRGFAELGSLAMLAGMYAVVLNLVVSNTRFPFLSGDNVRIVLALIGGGFGLSFIFANYEGSIIRSILESLKNIISVILGITNVFSDIMSYIRLWAVGLAGASISNTVNSMAGSMLGHAIIFAVVLLLVFGHGLNLILNTLSVLVHGVRLNTLEFSGHLGLTWSGIAYKPFAKTDKK
ncbi:MAG: V-type ATP synthase subunit I [Treponema sp.]|jgi:V/A-type H+-transporting ATPase subunit I|nr:V-type ATP synthase subunit I [Treponema sp.]